MAAHTANEEPRAEDSSGDAFRISLWRRVRRYAVPASVIDVPATGRAPAPPRTSTTRPICGPWPAPTATPLSLGSAPICGTWSPTCVPTTAVDRHRRCCVSPAFAARTPVEQPAGVWVHEVSHLLRDHHGRSDRFA